MGHLTGKEEILKHLRKRLHQNPVGLPEHPSVYEILSIFFTEKEAEVGSKFPFGLVTIEELQNLTGMNKDELEEILQGMMKKGLVTTSKKDHEVRYILSMAMVGFFEFNFMRASESLPMKRLAELIRNYRSTPEWAQEFFSPGTSRGRVFTYRDVLPKVKSEVLSFQEATEYIKIAGRGSLAKCYCRHEAWHLGKNCSAPIDDICMSLGIASDFLVEQGFARRASVNELLDSLKKAEDNGLVHIGDNVLEQMTFICNCCGCCCGFLDGITHHHVKNAVATTNYIARLNQEECNGCEICVDHCQIKAIRMEGDYPVVGEEFCLGCGVCAHFCPSSAMKMEEREKKIIPPKNYKELMIRLMKEKGRM
jgi:Na+-translocating ferredoxin:NAD+ oxidoreductase RNF subunit RnfB